MRSASQEPSQGPYPEIQMLAHHFEFLFESPEKFFAVALDQGVRARVQDKYSINKVKAVADSLGDFSNWDPTTHVHGKHISRYSGRTGYYREFFSREQIELLRLHCASFIEAFDYKVDGSG